MPRFFWRTKARLARVAKVPIFPVACKRIFVQAGTVPTGRTVERRFTMEAICRSELLAGLRHAFTSFM